MFVFDPAQIAFRAGIQDLPFNDRQGPQPDRPVIVSTKGTIESKYETLEGIPGLSNSKIGFETGRSLRYISSYLDKKGFNLTYGECFLGKVVHVVWHMRPNWQTKFTAFLLAHDLYPQQDRKQQDLVGEIQDYVSRRSSKYT